MKKHEFAVLIGRFSCFHLGHAQIVARGLEVAEKLIIVVGSHNRASNIKNPWNSSERIAMIEAALTEEEKSKITFVKMKDYLYSDAMWLSDIQNKIAEATNDSSDVALVGFDSDASSYYLKLFPKWQYYNCFTDYDFHATEIRDYLFTMDTAYKKCVHPNTAAYLEEWSKTESFKRLKDEFDFVRDYKEKWRGAPFAPTFVTVDTCVQRSGHILLVRRKGKVGKGLLALPGGFLNQDERILDGAIRELKEETAISLSKDVLKNAVVDEKVFDSPNRDPRGRTLTFAFMLNLGPGDLPRVKGSDDAERAFWCPLNEVFQRETEFFSDHFYIIQYFCNRF